MSIDRVSKEAGTLDGPYWQIKGEKRRPKRTEFGIQAADVPDYVKAITEMSEAEVSEHMDVDEEQAAEEHVEEVRANVPSSPSSLEVLSPSDSDGDLSEIPVTTIRRRLVPVQESQSSQEVEEKKDAPVTRRMARESGQDVWKWNRDLSQLPCYQGDDDFVVSGVLDEVEAATGTKKRTLTEVEELLLPISYNHLDPVRERAKQARKSDLELLKEQRRAKQQQQQNTVKDEIEPESSVQHLPIFDAPDDDDTTVRVNTRPNNRSSRDTSESSINRAKDATREKNKRKRPESTVNDFQEDVLPCYTDSFIVDDGYGYGVDPQYARTTQSSPPKANQRRPQQHGAFFDPDDSSNDVPPALPNHSSSPLPISPTRDPAKHKRTTTTRGVSALALSSPSTSPVRVSRAIPIPMATSVNIHDIDMHTDLIDVDRYDPERSNQGSVGSHSTLALSAGPTVSITSSITSAVPLPTYPNYKFRLNVRVKEETMLVVCKPDSTFEWLLKEAAQKYRQITRMEVELDHLETVSGARLIPQDKIEDCMNDSETVVGLIKESRPLSLVALYRSDCESARILESLSILERLAFSDQEEQATGVDGAHSLNLADVTLSPAWLPSLRGIFNLHTFSSIDLSENNITSSGFSEIITELAKSNGIDRLAVFNLSHNLIGLSLDLDISRRLLPKFSGLTSLNLSNNALNDRAVSALLPTLFAKCALTDLDLSGNLFGPDALNSLTIDSCPLYRLKSLKLAHIPLHQEGFLALIRLLLHPDETCQLSVLDLAYTNSFTPLEVAPTVAMHKKGHLSLDDAIDKLGRRANALTKLNLSGCQFDTNPNALLFPTLCMALKKITELSLADCGLSANDIKFLRSAVRSSEIISLNLSFNHLASPDATPTMDLLNNAPSTLTSAHFDSCGIPQQELEAILNWLPSRPGLLLLNLAGNVQHNPEIQSYQSKYANISL